jgi:hypothetical protein
VIELEDDDPSLMGLILNVLHYRTDGEDQTINAERLARLAIHCDKYDCVKALGPWVLQWFNNIERTNQTTQEFDFMLLAAYLFNDPGIFVELSKEASTELTPGSCTEWDEEEIVAIMPADISSELMRSASSCDLS